MSHEKQEFVQEAQHSALKFVRRVVGFAAQGALPSQSITKDALVKIDRTFPLGELSSTRELLGEMQRSNVLPSEKKAFIAGEEIKALYERVKIGPIISLSDSHQESDEDDNQDAPRA